MKERFFGQSIFFTLGERDSQSEKIFYCSKKREKSIKMEILNNLLFKKKFLLAKNIKCEE